MAAFDLRGTHLPWAGLCCLLASASASAQPIRYKVSGEGVALREQAFVLDVPARSHGDEAALARARLRGKLRFENTRDQAGTLVLEVRQEERTSFAYEPRGHLACFSEDESRPEEGIRLLAFVRGRELGRTKDEAGSICARLGPPSALAKGGRLKGRDDLLARHSVSTGGRAGKPTVARWEAKVEGCGAKPEEGVACSVQVAQVAEYRFEVGARSALVLEVLDAHPLQEKKTCCQRTFEGSFAPADTEVSGRLYYAMTAPMLSRCRAVGWSGGHRTGAWEVFESGPANGDGEAGLSVLEVACDVDDGDHVDHWTTRESTAVVGASSSVLPSRNAQQADSPFLAKALSDGSMTPWCSAAVAKPAEWVELTLGEDVAALALALGEGPRQYYGAGVRAPLSATEAQQETWREPTRLEIVPAAGGPAAAVLEIPKGARGLAKSVALAKGPWRVVVAGMSKGSGPVCIGELDLVPVKDRKVLESAALLRELLGP